MRKISALLLLTLATAAVAQDKQRKTPYWASIAAGEAMMRTGPGREFPGTWLYKRADLPIRIVAVQPNWRKVEDPGGTTGWMLRSLLSDTRTALVTGDAPRPVRKAANPDAEIVYRAQPGLVGRIARCGGDWCRIDIGGRIGFIETGHIWGVDRGETLP